MPIRKENFPPDLMRAVPVLNEAIEELSHGVEDGTVRKAAASKGIAVDKIRHYDAGEVVVGTTQLVLRHGLGVVPFVTIITMRSVGQVYESARADANRIWLAADAAGRRAHIVVLA